MEAWFDICLSIIVTEDCTVHAKFKRGQKAYYVLLFWSSIWHDLQDLQKDRASFQYSK